MTENAFEAYTRQMEARLQRASPEQCLELGRHVLSRLATFAGKADPSSLNRTQRAQLAELLRLVESGAIQAEMLTGPVHELNDSLAQQDDDEAELDGDLMAFLMAAECWLQFLEEDDRAELLEVAVNLMNVLDFYHVDSPLSEWLQVPEIQAEYQQQCELLGSK